MGRNPKKSQCQKSQPKISDVKQIDSTPFISDHEDSVNFITKYKELYEHVYDSNYDIDSDNCVAAIWSETANILELLNAILLFGNFLSISTIDSGSVCSIITKSLASNVLKTTPTAQWITSTDEKFNKTFSNEPIKVLGELVTTVTYNDWSCEDVCLTVVDDSNKKTILRYLSNSCRLSVVQQQSESGECFNNIDISTFKEKQATALIFSDLVLGIELSHIVKSKSHQKFTEKNQNSSISY